MSVKSRILSASAIALAIVSMPASALYVGSDVFQGVTFTFTQTSNTAFTLRIQNLLSTTNADWADVTQIGALQWKDLGGDAWTNASTVSGPGVGAYTVTQDKELSSSGCNQGNPPKAICFTFNPLVAASDDITFSFNLVGDIIAIDTTNADETKRGPHLKVNFMDAQGTQIGSLYSQQIYTSSSSSSTSSAGGEGSSSSSSSGNQVPESSSTLVLLGLGILGIGFMRRRKQAA